MRELVWVGSSLKDLKTFPKAVRRVMAYALLLAQRGDKHPNAKPLTGFGGAGVLEVVEDDDGNAYRTVYVITLPDAVYVLHAFQKKSKRGIKTPQPEIELIRDRLRRAEQLSAEESRRRGWSAQ